MEKSIKIKSKFYEKTDQDNCIAICLNVNANHILNSEIVTKLEKVVNEIFEQDYINNDLYKQQKENEKMQKENEKEHMKYQEKHLKLEKKKLSKNVVPKIKANKYDL